MYDTDLNRDVQAAGANAGALASATQKSAADNNSNLNFLINTTDQLTKTYIQGDLELGQRAGEKLQEEFLTSSKDAEQAKWAYGTNQAMQRDAIKGMKPLSEEGTEPALVEAAAQRLEQLQADAERLKAAAEGGMSNEQYLARVTALSKQYIAKYPGYADKVRQIIGAATGMEGADLWAQQQYVKDRFAKPTAHDGALSLEKIVAKDIDEAAKRGLGSQEELFALYNNDRESYNSVMRKSANLAGIEQARKTQEAQLGQARAESDADADKRRASFNAITSTVLTQGVYGSLNQQKEQRLAAWLQRVAKGEDVASTPELKREVDMHMAEMRTNIIKSREYAYGQINKYLQQNPNVSDAKRKELFADVDQQLKTFEQLYSNETGMQAMATALTTFRDKSLSEQMNFAELNIKLTSAMQNQPLVQQWYQGAEQRERIKREMPDFATFMEQLDTERTVTNNNIRTLTGAGESIGTVKSKVCQGTNGEVVSVGAGDDVAVVKAARDVVNNKAINVLTNAAKNGYIDPKDNACIQGALRTNMETGSCARVVASTATKSAENFKKLPQADQDTIKAAVSASSVEAYRKVRSIKEGVESKYGVQLQFGVNDAGQVAGYYKDKPAHAKLSAVEEMQWMKDNPEAIKYQQAMNEFFKLALPLTSNFTNIQHVVTQKDPKAISTEFAGLLNGNQPYTGFFSMAAQAPAGVSLGEDVVNAPPSTPESRAASDVRALEREIADVKKKKYLTEKQRTEILQILDAELIKAKQSSEAK